MKTFFSAVAALSLLFSCTNDKSAEKKLLDDIMATHEKVMANEDKLMNNKLIIDSLLKVKSPVTIDTAGKSELRLQSTRLATADNAMDDWMHNFDPHKKGRSGNDQVNYLEDQKKKIQHVDTLINTAVNASTIYLSSTKKP